MAEVAVAFGADDFGADAVGVGEQFDGGGDLIVETGPATGGREFVRGVKQMGGALFAGINSRYEMFIELAGKRWFGGFVDDDVFFGSG